MRRVNQLSDSEKENNKNIEILEKNIKDKDNAIKNIQSEMEQQSGIIKLSGRCSTHILRGPPGASQPTVKARCRHEDHGG